MRLAVILQSLRASAGEMGGMMGKKLGLGSARDLPVIRQNDISRQSLRFASVLIGYRFREFQTTEI